MGEREADGGVDVAHQVSNVRARAHRSMVLVEVRFPGAEGVERHFGVQCPQDSLLETGLLVQEVLFRAPEAEVGGAERESGEPESVESCSPSAVAPGGVVDHGGGDTGATTSLHHQPTVATRARILWPRDLPAQRIDRQSREMFADRRPRQHRKPSEPVDPLLARPGPADRQRTVILRVSHRAPEQAREAGFDGGSKSRGGKLFPAEELAPRGVDAGSDGPLEGEVEAAAHWRRQPREPVNVQCETSILGEPRNAD